MSPRLCVCCKRRPSAERAAMCAVCIAEWDAHFDAHGLPADRSANPREPDEALQDMDDSAHWRAHGPGSH